MPIFFNYFPARLYLLLGDFGVRDQHWFYIYRYYIWHISVWNFPFNFTPVMELRKRISRVSQCQIEKVPPCAKITELNKLMGSYFLAQNTKIINRVFPEIQRAQSEIKDKNDELKKILERDKENQSIEQIERMKEKEKRMLEVKKMEIMLKKKKNQLRKLKLEREECVREIEQNERMLGCFEEEEKESNLEVSILGEQSRIVSQRRGSSHARTRILNEKKFQNTSQKQKQQQLAKRASQNDLQKLSPQPYLKNPNKRPATPHLPSPKLHQLQTLSSHLSLPFQLSLLSSLLTPKKDHPITRQMFTNYSTNTYFSQKLKNKQIIDQLLRIYLL